MKPLRPKRLAVLIRGILNNWPAFAYIKPCQPGYSGNTYHIIAVDELESLRDKQAYQQSLHKE